MSQTHITIEAELVRRLVQSIYLMETLDKLSEVEKEKTVAGIKENLAVVTGELEKFATAQGLADAGRVTPSQTGSQTQQSFV